MQVGKDLVAKGHGMVSPVGLGAAKAAIWGEHAVVVQLPEVLAPGEVDFAAMISQDGHPVYLTFERIEDPDADDDLGDESVLCGWTRRRRTSQLRIVWSARARIFYEPCGKISAGRAGCVRPELRAQYHELKKGGPKAALCWLCQAMRLFFAAVFIAFMRIFGPVVFGSGRHGAAVAFPCRGVRRLGNCPWCGSNSRPRPGICKRGNAARHPAR